MGNRKTGYEHVSTRDLLAHAFDEAHPDCEPSSDSANLLDELSSRLAKAEAENATLKARDQAGFPAWIDDVIRDIAELPDRTSPDDFPEAMLVTSDELRLILTERASTTGRKSTQEVEQSSETTK